MPITEKRSTVIFEESLLAEIRTRPGSVASAVSECLERYYALLKAARRDLCGRFTPAELSLICDSLNGSIVQSWSLPYAFEGVSDSIDGDGLAEKWGVNGDALMNKLRCLTLIEKTAVIDAVERFWNSQPSETQPAEILAS